MNLTSSVIPVQATRPPGVPTRPATWVYTKTADQTGKAVEKASVTSPDVLKLGFPYEGGATATLTIRRTTNGTTLYIQVSQGQFNSSYQGGSARIRFDNQPWGTYAYSPAANGTGTTIFFDATDPLIRKIKASRTMAVDVAFNGQGRRQVTFKTAGLRWNS